MPRFFLLIVLLLIFSSCMKGEKVDLIVHNAVIHTMVDGEKVYEAMAIKDGKIVEVGPERQILNKYQADEIIDAGGRDVYPGFTDAHGHLFSYAQQKLSVNLFGTTTMEEVLKACADYARKTKRDFIVGRGWDQSLWGTNDLPTNKELSAMFPDIPVCLYRVDGHALIANDYLLKKAGISSSTFMNGGKVQLENGKPTGLLIDNAMSLVEAHIPAFTEQDVISAILSIQNELFSYGITSVHEAGIEFGQINVLKNLIDKHGFKLNTYAMLMASEDNISFAKENGIFSYKNLSIRSFKVMADGALGSRGALLKKPYEDEHGQNGLQVSDMKTMRKVALLALDLDYQMNTHCIGDSANALVLELYRKVNEVKKDHRFRIEHAQIIDPTDFSKFSTYGVLPSVQPTHAVSDQRWVENRIGKNRMKGAYAYSTLLKTCGMLALGTDFPVELTNPFLTIHAAVQRKNAKNEPIDGFLKAEALTLSETLKGMTIWAAYAAFQEKERGTLEVGKWADFAIFEKPIVSKPIFEENFSWMTFISGVKVYSAD
ncbi:MAG: amidohydrolase [Bacteroidetes bacterium]|nr:amidohydrolase [Bacteroidota bacterium]